LIYPLVVSFFHKYFYATIQKYTKGDYFMPKIAHEKFYLPSYKQHGYSPKALNWNSKESQTKRFEVILSLLKDEGEDLSIVDAGCGFGDFYIYAIENGFKFKEYIGIDILPIFVKKAKNLTKQKIFLKDVLVDDLPVADFYISSGMMNTFTKFETILFLKRALRVSKKGLIFNLLSSNKESEIFNYQNPNFICNLFNKKRYNCTIIRDYLDNDFTLKVNYKR
jgi:SAM-dependent methyltransferase